jgi:SAM-dependent methyltransferase
MDIYYKARNKCIVCDEPLTEALDFPNYPLSDIMLDYKDTATINQKLMLCTNCSHGQLLNIVHPDTLYGHYSFLTSVGLSRNINDKFFDFILRIIGPKHFKTIFEIGCNDCYLLNKLDRFGDKLVGIDPILCGREKEFNTDKLQVFGAFIEQLDFDLEQPMLILASHVLEHLDNPRSVLEKLLDKVNEESRFVFQFPEFNTLLKDLRFDQVYNHHLNYFSLTSFKTLLDHLNCEILAYTIDPHYWGTLTVAFKKSSNRSKNNNYLSVEFIRDRYVEFKSLMEITRYKMALAGDIMAYGASFQFPVLMYHINPVEYPEYIVDDDQNKEGKYFIKFNKTYNSY